MLTIKDVDFALKNKIQSVFGKDNFFEIKYQNLPTFCHAAFSR